MKLNVLFFLGAKSQSEVESQKITPVDKSWMNPNAFQLPAGINFRTDRAFDIGMIHEGIWPVFEY